MAVFFILSSALIGLCIVYYALKWAKWSKMPPGEVLFIAPVIRRTKACRSTVLQLLLKTHKARKKGKMKKIE
jgi:hypothetical protein